MEKDFVRPQIPDRMYFKIGEVSQITSVEPYVLRYWETEFELLSPQKSKAKQRVYEKKDIENILIIKNLLWKERYSIEGAKKRLKELRREQRVEKREVGKSLDVQKLRRIKNELKDLIYFLRAN